MDFKQVETQVLANRHYSSACFNETWTYLDSENPEITEMLACAYASLYHWLKRDDAKEKHLLTAHWLLAKSYEKAQIPTGCRMHADQAFKLIEANSMQGLDLLSAYEVQARAYYLEGNKVDGLNFKNKGYELLASLKAELNEEEFGYCKDDLDSIVEHN